MSSRRTLLAAALAALSSAPLLAVAADAPWPTKALRIVVPPLVNNLVALLKDSSLVSVITMVELTKVYGQLASTYYDYLGIGLLTAAMYFVIGLPFVRLSRALEKRFMRGRQPLV